MHEKDVQLARLLIARQTELNETGEGLREQVRSVQQRLDEIRLAADERNSYADILAKAANLLQRDDLTVEAEDTSAEERELASLHEQLKELEEQEAQFRELTDALRQKAPQLFDAATGELSLAPASSAGVAASDPEAEAAPAGPAADSEPEPAMAATEPDSGVRQETADGDWDESVKVFVAGRQKELSPEDEAYLSHVAAMQSVAAEAAEAAETAAASAPDEPMTDEEKERFLSRFNVDAINRQVLQVLGSDARFVVDAASVMNNIPYYDHAIRGGPVKFILDEMLRDFGLLARHLGRQVHLVLDHEHAVEHPLDPRITLQTLRGGDQNQRSAQDTLLKSVLADAAQRTQVCLITGELTLGGSLRSRRVQFLPVTDFFRT